MLPPDPLALIPPARIVPVLTIARASDAVPLARALVAAGLPLLEITLRTSEALAAIAAIAREVPDAVVGAGTVTTADDIARAKAAGARFLVSPGTPAALLEGLAECGLPALPGCSTVSEAMALAERGFSLLKFFPAEASGGISWLKAVAAPLPAIAFCPTGGIDARNAATYLALPNVACIGGSWVAPQEAIASGDFDRVTSLARTAVALAGA